jgi:hypothetical protein
MGRDVAEPVAGLVDETLIVRWVEDAFRSGFWRWCGAVSQTLVCETRNRLEGGRQRPRPGGHCNHAVTSDNHYAEAVILTNGEGSVLARRCSPTPKWDREADELGGQVHRASRA